MKEFYCANSEETEKLGFAIGQTASEGDIICLSGDLGAGKTAFTRGLAHGMGFDGEVSSPTFALVHEYPADIPIYHFDMYRITTWDDLYSTGFFDYLDMGGVLVIEWSENIENCLPENSIRVSISKNDNENERIITLERGAEIEDTRA